MYRDAQIWKGVDPQKDMSLDLTATGLPMKTWRAFLRWAMSFRRFDVFVSELFYLYIFLIYLL